MIQQVSHTVPGTDPAGLALALAVAHELHAPATRAAEVAPTAVRTTPRKAARTTDRRTTAARTRRRSVRG